MIAAIIKELVIMKSVHITQDAFCLYCRRLCSS
jgi:hypothetical protein